MSAASNPEAILHVLKGQDDGPSHPPYVTIFRVRNDFQLPERWQKRVIPGLVCCQVLTGDDGAAYLYLVWKSRSFFTTEQLLLYQLLSPDYADSILEWQGHQREFWHREIKKPWRERIFTWSFVVSALAVLGVIHGLATYFESFTSWACAIPRTVAVNPGTTLELLENTPSSGTFSIRNDSTGGRCTITVERAYLVNNLPVGAKGPKTTKTFPATIPTPTVYQSLEPTKVVEIPSTLPALLPGDYRLIVEGEQKNGWLWQIWGPDKFTLEARKIRVMPQLNVGTLTLARTRTLSDRGHYEAYAQQQITPGVNCNGITGRAWLVHDYVRIRSVIGPDISVPMYPQGPKDHSGVKWDFKETKARSTRTIVLIMESSVDVDWSSVLSQVQTAGPEFATGS